MLNKGYVDNAMQAQIKESYAKDKAISHVLLQDFLDANTYDKLREEINDHTFTKEKKFMHHSFWKAPLTPGVQDAISSPEFLSFVSSVVGEKIERVKGDLFSFEHKDFEILHDDVEQKEQLDIILDFTSEWEETAGGQLVYTDGKGEVRPFPATKNGLVIVKKSKDFQRFVKYVNNRSEGKRRLLCVLHSAPQ